MNYLVSSYRNCMRIKQVFYLNNYALVLVSWVAIAACTVAGASMDGGLETISEMITRSSALEIAFGMTVLLSLLCNGAVLYGMIQERMHQNDTARMVIMVIYAASGCAMLAFGVVTTETDDDFHTSMAMLAFSGFIAVTAGLLYAGYRYVVHVHVAVAAVGTCAASGLAWIVTSEPAFEYVLVTALHVAIAAQIEEHAHFTQGVWVRGGASDTIVQSRLQERRCTPT